MVTFRSFIVLPKIITLFILSTQQKYFQNVIIQVIFSLLNFSFCILCFQSSKKGLPVSDHVSFYRDFMQSANLITFSEYCFSVFLRTIWSFLIKSFSIKDEMLAYIEKASFKNRGKPAKKFCYLRTRNITQSLVENERFILLIFISEFITQSRQRQQRE